MTEQVLRPIDSIAIALRQHQPKLSGARGVEQCTCGWSKMGEPGAFRKHQTEAVLQQVESDFGDLSIEWGVNEIDHSTIERRKKHLAHISGIGQEVAMRRLRILLDRDPERRPEARLVSAWRDLPTGDDSD